MSGCTQIASRNRQRGTVQHGGNDNREVNALGIFGRSAKEPIRSDMGTAKHRRTATTKNQDTASGRVSRVKVQRIAKTNDKRT